MKTLTFLILFFTLSTISAQIVNIPDPAFKDALLNHELHGEVIDTNGDGEIQYSEAEAITELYVGDGFINFGIQDMTGVEAFVNITKLYCINNYITYLNLTQNTHLQIVDCWKNYLLSLDVRNGNNTNISLFNSGYNPNLMCIFVDDAEYSENSPVWHKDPASTYVETQEECDALSIEDNTLETVYLLPNPVQDILYLHIPTENLPLEIDITDISSKRISNHIIINPKTELNLSFLQPGIYFIILKDKPSNTILTKKLIKL